MDQEIRVGPDTFLAGYWIPDIRLIIYARYPALTGYYGRKQTFCHNPVLCSWSTNTPLYLIFCKLGYDLFSSEATL